jgi:hypothetical protein
VRKISMMVSAAVFATMLALGVAGMAPAAASASTGPGLDTLQQYAGYGYPYVSYPYDAYPWPGWSTAGLPAYLSGSYDDYSPAWYSYSPWSYYGWPNPIEGSPGAPYDYHGSYFGYGSGYGYGGPYYGGYNYGYGYGRRY